MLSIGSNINEVRVDGSLRALRRDLEAFQEFGLGAAEISIHGLDLVRNGRLDRRRTAEVRTVLADFGFRCSTHAPNPLNLMNRHIPELHRDVLYASLEFSAIIGAGCMVYHPGRYLAEEEFGISGPKTLPPDETRELLDHEAKVLQEAADRFPEVIIAMENARPYLHHSPYCYAELPFELLAQIRRINRPNVRMTLDFGHLQLAERYYGFDPVAAVSAADPFIAHCHVHDNFGHPVYYNEKIQTQQIPFGRGDSHMPVGWGSVPFHNLFALFIHDFQGLLICELRSRYFEQTGEAAANLAAILHDLGVEIGKGRAEISSISHPKRTDS
ncbi:MAG: sugar phosphate isomerase/epimerase family protein [Desulfoprunum sp.]|jgi:sugar phosphate isomerase/epimerase|uniref:sugar phosphate isomerase/epimerase family protein n=1 Tax=Desulfoprunum sp. TaxID=2020866 RepID=UPI000B2B971A